MMMTKAKIEARIQKLTEKLYTAVAQTKKYKKPIRTHKNANRLAMASSVQRESITARSFKKYLA